MLSRFTKSITLSLIFLAIILYAAFSGMDQVTMRRESFDRPAPIQGEIVLSLDQALNLSLAIGDGRRVNWDEVI